MELPKAISAILFYRAEPMSVKELGRILKRSSEDIRDALTALEGALESTGLCLIRKGDEVTIGTKPEAGELIEEITREELSRDLSKAALETLSIVLYKGPITRSEIDYVRGVNSTFILRNLLIRGLIEKIDNPKDQRSFLYQPTFQLLEYMGVSKIAELPEYDSAMAMLANFVAEKEGEATERDAVVPEGETSTEDADVAEEDTTGENFDNNELHAHTEHDRALGI